MISFCIKRCLSRYKISFKLKHLINLNNCNRQLHALCSNLSLANQELIYDYRCFSNDLRDQIEIEAPAYDDNLPDIITFIQHEASCNHLVPFDALSKAVDLMTNNDFRANDAVQLIKCCGELMPNETANKKLELAQKLLKITIDKNIVNSSHYNAFLDILRENECKISAQKFLSSMIAHVSPDVATYEKLLYCVCSTGDISQTSSIITEMKKLNYPISEEVFNALILGHGRAGDFANARAIMDTMLNAQVFPSERTYASLLIGFAGSSEPYHILQTLREAKSKQIRFECKSLFEVVFQLAMTAHDKYIPNVLLELPYAPSLMMIKAFCMRLIHKGAPNSAHVVLVELLKPEKASSSQDEHFGTFLIKELIYADTSISTIFDICESLMSTGKNMYALHTAYITAVKCGSPSALPILNYMKELGIEIRPHYFWPLIVSAGEHSGDAGVIGILRAMLNLRVPPDFQTLRDYALPRLDLHDPVTTARKLQDLRLAIGEILHPLICFLLYKNRIKDCVKLVDHFKRSEIEGKIIVRQLVKAVISGAAPKDVIIILKAIKSDGKREEINNKTHIDHAGLLALEVITTTEQKKYSKELYNLIKCYKSEGIKISNFAIDIIADYFVKSSFMIDNLELLLNELRSSDCAIPVSELSSQMLPHPRDMDLDTLENHLIDLRSKKMNVRGVLRRLLQGHCRKGNIQRALEILEECESKKIMLSPGMQASILELHVKTKNLDKAEKTFRNLRRQAPWFKLDEHKMIDYATFLIREGQLQGSISILKQYCADHNVLGGDAISQNCFRLLNALSETGTPAQVRQVLKELVELKFCTINNALLGPLIRSHLNRNDFEGAVQEFLISVDDFKSTPLQLELITHLAKRNETNLLDRVLDACKKVHGVVSTSTTLAIAYASANMSVELRRLLTDPSSRVSPIFLRKRCERLEVEGNYLPMEVLAEVCKDLPQYIPDDMYERILRIHCRRNNCEAAVELYNKILDQDRKPTIEFLCALTHLLQCNKYPLPKDLEMPEMKTPFYKAKKL